MSRVSAVLAVANRPKPGRQPEYDIDGDELEPKPFERSIARKLRRKEAR